MRLFLESGPSHVRVLSRREVREFRDAAAAREYLAPLAERAGNTVAIREALVADGWRVSPSDAEMLDALAERIANEGLLVVSCVDAFDDRIRATAESQAVTPTPAAAEADASTQETPAPLETHWIEIALVDDEGQPVANEPYLIELPDGTAISGVTGSDGRARVEGVDRGTAKVSFPDRDKEAYTPA